MSMKRFSGTVSDTQEVICMSIIVPNESQASTKIGEKILMPCQTFLPASQLEAFFAEVGYDWRQRIWGPLEIFWSCVLKHLNGVHSARAMEHHLGSLQESGCGSKRDGVDFCRARQRFPKAIFETALEYTGQHRPSEGITKVFGLSPVLVDGFTSKAPNTKANREHFGQSQTRNGPSRLPIVRSIIAICAGSGTVLRGAFGRYKESEQFLFKGLLEGIYKDMLVIGDRHFCSFPILWSLLEKGAHGLFRKHQSRKGQLFKTLGYKDTVMRWSQKGLRHLRCPAWDDLAVRVTKDLYVRHIERVIVRKGYRSFTLKLCTTLIDPKEYPANKLVEVYLQRWRIEGDILSLKSNHGLRRLTGHSPDVVYKELLSGLLAYSLVCNLKAETGADPRRLSCLETCRLLQLFSERMVEAPETRLESITKCLIREITLAEVPIQKRPPEPRILVTKPTRFKMFKVSRVDWKKWYKKQLA